MLQMLCMQVIWHIVLGILIVLHDIACTVVVNLDNSASRTSWKLAPDRPWAFTTLIAAVCASRACHIVVWRAGQNFACTANALSASLNHPSSCCWPVGYICLHAWRLLETVFRQFRYQACILHCIKRGVLQRACKHKLYDARLHHFQFTMLLAKKALNIPAVTCCNIASGIQAPHW